jgi:hypothetical protein
VVEPDPAPTVEQEPAPVARPEIPRPEAVPAREPSPAPQSAREPDGEPLDVARLPYLSEHARKDLGLPEIQVQFPRPNPPGESVASAVINWEPVRVGEYIGESDAVLIGVVHRGVGIEVRGQRFFIPLR